MQAADVRPTVLVTEDEALISLDLCEALQDAGYDVIGPANTMRNALFLLDRQRPQVAVIDLQLKDGSCTRLMHQLHRRGVPFLVYSGYSKEDDLIAVCHGAPWVSKPSAPQDLIETLEGLLRQAVPA